MKWNIGKILSKRQMSHPDKVAIIFEDSPISYDRLNRETNQVAHFFKQTGLKKGDRVAADLMNCPGFLTCYFAAAKLGLIFVPLNFRLEADELLFQINQCQSRLLVFHSRFADRVEKVRENLSIESDKFVCLRENAEAKDPPSWALDYDQTIKNLPDHEVEPDHVIDLDDPFLIMYTSGTTGDPKGAVITHGQTYFKCFQIINYTDMRQDDVFQSQAPLCHSAGLAAVTTPALCRGATLLMRLEFDPEKFGQDIETYQASIVFGLSTMMRFVLETGVLDRVNLQSVRFAFGGGEKTAQDFYDTLEEKGLELLPGFGQTENSAMVLMPPNAPKEKAGSAGLPNFFTELWIEDELGRRLEPGQIGQIVVMGPNVMKEYWGMPDATAATLVDDKLYTGDLGYVDKDGYVYIVDRVKDMYRSGAENVYPAEVESVLEQHPKITRAAVIGVPDDKWGETGKAFVVCRDSETITHQEVIAFLAGRLARFKFPKSIRLITSLPVTLSGKVKKSALKKMEDNAKL